MEGKRAAAQFQTNQVIIDAMMLILGITLIIWPTDSATMLTRILGIVLIIGGLIELVVFIRLKEKSFFDVVSLIGGIIMTGVGIWLALNPAWLVQFFNILFGVVIITYGLFNIINSFLAKQVGGYWFIPLIMGVIAIAFGAVILLNPTFIQNVIMIVIGVALIFAAITGIINDVRLHKAKKAFEKMVEQQAQENIKVNLKDAGSDDDNDK